MSLFLPAVIFDRISLKHMAFHHEYIGYFRTYISAISRERWRKEVRGVQYCMILIWEEFLNKYLVVNG
jgi:hypothetical protein